jgi:hypothetical protein
MTELRSGAEADCQDAPVFRDSWAKLMGFPCPPATRTPMSAAHFAEATKNVTFITPQKNPDTQMSPIIASSSKHCSLDLLDNFCLSQVLKFVNTHEGGQSLPGMARFCSAYKRAFLLEKEFHYGHILLGCQANGVPPLRWFEKRIPRISSITSPHLPQSRPAVLPHHPIHIQLTSFRNEDYRSIKKYPCMCHASVCCAHLCMQLVLRTHQFAHW